MTSWEQLDTFQFNNELGRQEKLIFEIGKIENATLQQVIWQDIPEVVVFDNGPNLHQPNSQVLLHHETQTPYNS